jgi:hypothetical protein
LSKPIGAITGTCGTTEAGGMAIGAAAGCDIKKSARQRRRSCSRTGAFASRLRLEHRELAPHERVAVAGECPVVGLELLDLPAMHCLPWALMADLFGDELVEGAIAADDEDVVVGDGAEECLRRTVI